MPVVMPGAEEEDGEQSALSAMHHGGTGTTEMA